MRKLDPLDFQEQFIGYVSKEVAARKSVHEAIRRASFAAINMPTSERMTQDANMHHVLRLELVQLHRKFRKGVFQL